MLALLGSAIPAATGKVVDPRLPRPRPGAASNAPAAVPAKPEAKPEAKTEPKAEPEPTSFYGFAADLKLKAALDALDESRYADARALAAEHPDPLAASLVDWLIARESDSGLSALDIIRLVETHPGWPERDMLTLRAEQAFHALAPSGAEVLTFYSQTPPRTVGGNLAYAAALRDAGRHEESRRIVQDLWREWPLAPNQAGALMTRFGGILTRDDHIYRFRRLVLRGQSADALAEAALLGSGYDALAKAVIAVIDRDADGAQKLRAVTPTFFGDPLYVFAEMQLKLRAGEPVEAARLLLRIDADKKLPGDADIWWDTRRDLSRALLDRNTADLAYRVAAGSRATGEGEQVEAAFHAGWYALRFLKDPVRAEPHFRDLIAIATLPRTRARASYWLGRTFEAENKTAAARLAYSDAAQYGGCFYGQLAREKLGVETTGLERAPAPSALDRIRFAELDGVRAIKLLTAAGHPERAYAFIQSLAHTADTPGEIALLTALARRIGQPRAAVSAAALAGQRGIQVASLPVPFIGVPAGLPLPEPVDRALVYAVVRQESAFNFQATSQVGARGLMQLMPATAKATAARAQMPYSVQRLTEDPLYNATLGAHHLGELLDRLDRSYVLTFVAYNAGPGRARDWVAEYGDLRGGTVDPVDWIERIPFDETRDYVQKVMENLQVYRSRIGHPLSLTRDLIRGGPQG